MARLPLSGKAEFCGLYDVVPSKAGQVNNLTTFSDSSTQRSEIWQGNRLQHQTRASASKLFAQGAGPQLRPPTNSRTASPSDNPGQFSEWLRQQRRRGERDRDPVTVRGRRRS